MAKSKVRNKNRTNRAKYSNAKYMRCTNPNISFRRSIPTLDEVED